jgi:hypothetical protein
MSVVGLHARTMGLPRTAKVQAHISMSRVRLYASTCTKNRAVLATKAKHSMDEKAYTFFSKISGFHPIWCEKYLLVGDTLRSKAMSPG